MTTKNSFLCVQLQRETDLVHRIVLVFRVVTFLSPAYLESPACVEQYNIALCCKRAMRRELLAPFYIETVDSMPTYMALVQYADCRYLTQFPLLFSLSLTDGQFILQSVFVFLYFRNKDGNKEKMIVSVKAFIAVFETTIKLSVLKPLSMHYDVFISYSHRNTEKAKKFLEQINAVTKSRDLNIFFDKNELRTGEVPIPSL